MDQFNLREDLTAGLRSDLTMVQSKLALSKGGAANLLFGHLCCGRLELPDALRITEVVDDLAKDSLLGQLNSRDEGLASAETHRLAFRRHIRGVGREGVLLEWLSDWSYHNRAYSAETTQEIGLYTVDWGVSAKSSPHISYSRLGDGIVKIRISRTAFKRLLPETWVTEYLGQLYGVPNPEDNAGHLEISRRRLTAAVENTVELISGDPNARKAAESLIGNARRDEKRFPFLVRSLLTAFQTGLMFVAAARGFQGTHLGGVSVAMVFGKAEVEGTDLQRIPLGLLSAIPENWMKVNGTIEILKTQLLQGAIRNELTKLANFRSHSVSSGKLSAAVGRGWAPDEIMDVIRTETEANSASPVSAWPIAITMWLAAVVERLRYAVHEGLALSFTFLVADRSVLEDSEFFDVVPLRENAVSTNFGHLATPFEDAEDLSLKDRLETTVRQIADNNYAWFNEGRYALLWDSTLPESGPQALVSICGGSWDVFISRCRYNDPPFFSEAAGTLVYVRRDGTGGMISRGKGRLSFSRGTQWFAGDEEREETIRQIVNEGASGIAKGSADKLVRVLSAVSADPHLGCMVIFLGECRPRFEPMGQLWRLKQSLGENLAENLDELRDQELVSLMGMDGATCIWKSKDSGQLLVDFRRLVQLSGGSAAELDSRDKGLFLDGQGSRKWSAAMAATHPDVKMVIAISQDGPIFSAMPQDKHEIIFDGLAESTDEKRQGKVRIHKF